MKKENIYLKRLEATHVTDDYVNWMNDKDINKYLESRHEVHSLSSIKNFVKHMSQNDTNFLFGIFCSDTSKHIGNIKLGPIDYRYNRAEIGLIIGNKKYWGKGLATEAIIAVCNIASRDLKLRKVEAGCYSSNVGSKKAFEKAGFELEGLLKKHFCYDGKVEDCIRLGKVLMRDSDK
jgi:RimJ/RimL family protein N-acetyltransferase